MGICCPVKGSIAESGGGVKGGFAEKECLGRERNAQQCRILRWIVKFAGMCGFG